jgi:diguanylate cyclase (GGDEF)-like protein/PAS domain S-box-containing protein
VNKKTKHSLVDIELFEKGPVVVFIWKNEAGWPVERVSANLLPIYGYEPLQYLQGTLKYVDQIHPDDLSRISEEIAAASSNLDSSTLTHQPYRYMDAFGKYRWVKDSSQIIRSEDGDITHYIGYLIDITDEIELQEEANHLKERLDLAWTGINDGLWDWEIQSNSVYFSPRWKEMIGYGPDEFPNDADAFFEAIHPEDQVHVKELLGRHFKDPQNVPYEIDIRILSKNAEYKWIRTRGKTTLNADGTPHRMVGAHTDIDESKKQSHFFQVMQERYKALMENASDGIFIMDTEGWLLECSLRAAQMLGYSMQEMKKLSVYDWDVSHTKEEAMLHVHNTPTQPISFETQHKRKDGTLYDASITAVKIYVMEQEYIYASVRDITHQKKIEKELLETNKKLSNIAGNVPGVLYTFKLSPDGSSCFPYASEHIYDIYGVMPQDVQEDAAKVFGVLHPEDIEHVSKSIQVSFKKLAVWEDVYRVIHPDKGVIWVKGTAKPEKQADGSVLWYGYIHDITKSRLAEIAVQNAKHYYATLLEAASDGVHILDLEGNVVAYSRSFAKHLGYEYEEVATLNVAEWDVAIEKEKLKAIVRELALVPRTFETQHRKKDGTVVDVQINAKGIELDGNLYLYASARDITESQRLKEEIINERNFISTIVDNANTIIAVINTDGTMIRLNKYGENFTGYTQDEVASEPYFWTRFLDTKIQGNVMQVFQKAQEGTMIKTYQNSWISRSGEERLFEWSNSLVRKANGELDYVFTIGIDITESERKKQEFKTIFEISRDGIAILDLKSNFLDFNDAYLSMTGFSREELLSKSCLGLSIPEDHERAQKAMQIVMESGYLESFEKTCLVKNGKRVVIRMALSLMPDKKRIMISTTDITDMRDHEQELEFIAHFDPLTKLPNRTLFSDRMKQGIANAHRSGQKLAIAYLDLDGFKQVNDTYGHETGDVLLVEVSKRMQKALREGDTLARLGGDEFVAILGNQNDKRETFAILNRLLEAAAAPVEIEKTNISVSASIGVTFYSKESDVDADILLRQADQAMYEAKLRGKNQMVVFEDIFEVSNQVGESALAIKNALQKGEFVLYYQPKVNMKSSEIIGVEALIRWNNPTAGMVYPDDFLPVVDNRPLMFEIDQWVFNEALSQLCLWHKEGFDTKVSINISAYTFKQPNFLSLIDAALAKHPNVKPQQIDIEILESSALHEIEEVRMIIEALHERNISVSLDDFGTGYSTLSYLKKLGIDTLKIDKSFVLDILHDAGDLSIVDASVGLAEAFRAQPLAEGVESVEHGNVLLGLGCELAQGYIISRPMSPELLPQWVKEWKSPQSWQEQ